MDLAAPPYDTFDISDPRCVHALYGVHEAGHGGYAQWHGYSIEVEFVAHPRTDAGHTGHSAQTGTDAGLVADPDRAVLYALTGSAAEWRWAQHQQLGDAMVRFACRLSGSDRRNAEQALPASSFADLAAAWAAAVRWVDAHWNGVLALGGQIAETCDCLTNPDRPNHAPPAPTETTPQPAPAAASTTPSGGTMSGIDEVRAALGLSTENAQQAIAALQQASELMDQVRSTVAQVTESSAAEETAQASAAFAAVEDGIREQGERIRGGLQALESYQQRL